MTLTFRSTVGRRLTVSEGDGNVAHLATRTIDAYTPQHFGAVSDGSVDVTAAWNSTRAACASTGRAFYIPAGDYLLTVSSSAITGQFTMFGDGPFHSRIIFRPTTHSTAALTLSNGASRCERVFMRDFSIYSDDVTYTKIALDVYDLSVCGFERMFIWGTGGSGPSAGACWSGNTSTSIGIRTHGREATYVDGVEIVADRPIVIAANPNTAAADGEDMDHWDWKRLYMVGNGNPLISVDDGLGIEETTFEGYEAWVAGTGAFRMNDNRSTATIPSRGIVFRNFRYEQCEQTSSYAFDMTFSTAVQQITFQQGLMASGSNGIRLTGFDRAVIDQVTAAMSTIALTVSSANSNSVLEFRAATWQSGATVSTPGLTLAWAGAYNSTQYAAPANAIYVGQIRDTSFNVGHGSITAVNATEALLVTGTTGDALQVYPLAPGSGANLRAVNNARNDYEPMLADFETLTLRYRTAAAVVSTAASVDTSGQFSYAKRMFLAKDTGDTQNNAGMFAGNGVPDNGNGSNGDTYLRGDGFISSNTFIYHKEGGSWVAATTA